MALTKYYLRYDLSGGTNDGTSWATAWETWADVVSGIDSALTSSTYGIELQVYDGNGNGSRQSISAFTLVVTNNTKPLHIRSVTAEDTYGRSYWTCNGRMVFRGYVRVDNIDIEGSYTADIFRVDLQALAYQCKIVNTLNTIGMGASAYQGGQLIYCDIESRATTVNEAYTAVTLTRGCVYGCRIKCDTYGAVLSSGTAHGGFVNNIIMPYSTTGESGVLLKAGDDSYNSFLIRGNRIYDFTNGVNIDSCKIGYSVYNESFIRDNIISSCTNGIILTDGESAGNTFMISIWHNAIYNCTNDYSGFDSDMPLIDAISLSTDPFIDAANEDFTIHGTAWASDLKDAGFAKNMPYDWDNWDYIATYEAPVAGGVSIPVLMQAYRRRVS